jgi:hypothetical protein
MVMSVFAMGTAGAAPTNDLDFSGDTAAPNPFIDVDSLTVARHPADKGFSDDAMAGYYDDAGEWVDDPEFVVNTTMDKESGDNINPYSFKPGHADDPDFNVFPRTGTNDDGDQVATVTDASEWSTDTSGTSGSMTVSDTQVAEGAEAVNFDVGGTSGDVAFATYSNWTSELDSDEEKRVLQISADVNSFDSGTDIFIKIEDETGDYKQVEIDPDDNYAADSVVANATGDSQIEQVKLADLSTNGAGDFDNIEKINVSIEGGSADFSISWLDLQSKGEEKLAEKRVDEDGDGTYDETTEIYDAQGAISTYSMETLGSEFDNAVINDVSFPAKFTAEKLNGDMAQDGAYYYQWDSAEQYPAYDHVGNFSYRLHLPAMIDLSYSGADLMMEQGLPSERYNTLGVAEGAGEETNFSDMSFSDVTGSLADSGDEISLDASISTDTYYGVQIKPKVTENEKAAMLSSGGGGAAPVDSSNKIPMPWNDPIGFVMTLPGFLITAGLGIFGIRWKMG